MMNMVKILVLHILMVAICLFVLQSDVNTVCFADESGHLIYSGSDDNLCKVNPLCSHLPGWSKICILSLSWSFVSLIEAISVTV